ncbi:MAG: DUF4360 domain-containing protein [Deltaproteobacteria bacterium]|nr:DUF4360 domain-containing protein [Deltaproteobacteria bacterium]
MRNLTLVVMFVFSLLSVAALADDISLKNPIYGGSGCPSGTASVTLSPDQKSLSVLFDQYVVEVGKNTGRKLDRKSCNLAIPVHIPQGLSVSIYEVDYRGFNSLPMGARSTFNVEYFFAGSRGPMYRRDFFGPLSTDYTISNTLEAGAIVWSSCGADVILRVNSNMLVQTNRWNDQALSTVDSADLTAGLIYQLQWRRCGGF